MNDLKWICNQTRLTSREWKSRKRKEIREVIKAFEIYRLGCYYTPDGEGEVGQIDEALKSIKQKLSVKNWGK